MSEAYPDSRVFSFLTDDVYDPYSSPLLENWPGWWSKIELFGRFWDPDRTYIYFDLDTVIQGDLRWLVESAQLQKPGEIWLLSDFGRPELAQTGVMVWTGDLRRIYNEFASRPDYWMRTYGGDSLQSGDGAFVRSRVDGQRLQDLFPGRFASYKLSSEEEREAASVICFHGQPRPWDVGY